MPDTACMTIGKARGFKTLRLFGFLTLLAAVSPCALIPAALVPAALAQTSEEGLRMRLDQMDNDIRTLSRTVYKGDTPPLPLTPPVNGLGEVSPSGQAGLELRLSQLENELRSMTGKIEELQHQNQTMQQALDQATAKISALELKPAAPMTATTGALDMPGSDMPVSDMPPQPTGSLTRPDMAEPTGERFTGGTAYSSADSHAVTPVVPPRTLGTLTQSLDGAVTTTPGSPDQAYENAYAMVRAQNYDQAEPALASFLAKYPKHPLAANAQYWLGETYYGRSQFDKSAKAFALAYQKYPQSPKSPDALLKLGLSLNNLGKHDEACLTFGQLKNQFPDAVASIAKAEAESKKAACRG